MSVLGVLLLFSSLPLALLAVATVTGLGLMRNQSLGLSLAVALALVLLPALGLSTLSGRPASGGGPARRAGPVGAALWLWGLALLLVLPRYFPYERVDAAREGLAELVAFAGPEARERAGGWAASAMGWLGSEPPPLPTAQQVEREPAAGTAVATLEGSPSDPVVVLPYDGNGQRRVQVFFDGPRYGEQFPMFFDTGATLTTLDRATLRALEIEVPADAPRQRMRTANGEVEAELVLLDGVWLGEALVEWVTVAVCDSCAGPETSGLLGNNVTGQFQVALDPDRSRIELRVRGADRTLDVGQWLRLRSSVRAWEDGRMEVEVRARNQATVGVVDAVASVVCPDAVFEVALSPVPGATSRTTRMALPRHTDCPSYTLELTRARWELGTTP